MHRHIQLVQQWNGDELAGKQLISNSPKGGNRKAMGAYNITPMECDRWVVTRGKRLRIEVKEEYFRLEMKRLFLQGHRTGQGASFPQGCATPSSELSKFPQRMQPWAAWCELVLPKAAPSCLNFLIILQSSTNNFYIALLYQNIWTNIFVSVIRKVFLLKKST